MAKISFDPEAWSARTQGFPRLVAAILFDISLHNWRTGTSMSLAHYRIITSDLPGQGEAIADMLLQAGAIEQDDNGIWSPAAIAEWSAAEQWREGRAKGGRNKAKAQPKPVERAKPAVKPAPPAAPAPAPAPPSEEDQEAAAKVQRVEDARKALTANIQRLGEAWNAMALKSGLAQIKAISDKRKEQSGARIREHGIDALLAAVEAIPQSAFLMGENDRKWVADFDFIIQPSSCLKLIEGKYHVQGEGKASGWR